MTYQFSLSWMAVFLSVTSIHAQPTGKVRLDLLGDPLPAGALARLGTLRFKQGSVSSRLIKKVAFSADGSKIASLTGLAMPSRLRLWNAASVQNAPGPWEATEFQYTAFAFSPDAPLLAVAAVGVAEQGAKKAKAGRQICFWHIATGKSVQTIISPPEQIQDDIESGQPRRQLSQPPAQNKGAKGFTFRSNLAFSDDGKALASGTAGDNVVRVWDTATGKERMVLTNQKAKYGVLMLALSPDGRTVAAGEHQIRLWEVLSGKLRKAFPDSDSLLRTLQFSPDGRWLASGSADSTVLIWDTRQQ